MIFMGCGDRTGSRCFTLVKRLMEGIFILSGLQQPPHSSSKEEAARDKEERWLAEMELKDVIADLRTALGDRRMKGNQRTKK
jgi:hypothetical protein